MTVTSCSKNFIRKSWVGEPCHCKGNGCEFEFDSDFRIGSFAKATDTFTTEEDNKIEVWNSRVTKSSYEI